MKIVTSVVTRRDFIRGTVGATLSARLLGPELLKAVEVTENRSTVFIVRDPDVMDDVFNVNKVVLKKMLQEIVTGITGEKQLTNGLLKLVTTRDVIGLTPTPMMNPTHDELIQLITDSLVEAGVPAGNIRNAQGRGVDLQSITALISMPGLKAHWLTGIGTVIKNYIMYSANPRDYHNEDSAKLGEIWQLPHVKGKTRLILVDALRPVCDRGPQVDPRYRWPYSGLIAGTDPVAVEAVCLKIIEEKRAELRGEPWPLSPPPICVEAADKVYRLGNSDLGRIDIKKIGWTEGLLV